jgi:hypothetical protein
VPKAQEAFGGTHFEVIGNTVSKSVELTGGEGYTGERGGGVVEGRALLTGARRCDGVNQERELHRDMVGWAQGKEMGILGRGRAGQVEGKGQTENSHHTRCPRPIWPKRDSFSAFVFIVFVGKGGASHSLERGPLPSRTGSFPDRRRWRMPPPLQARCCGACEEAAGLARRHIRSLRVGCWTNGLSLACAVSALGEMDGKGRGPRLGIIAHGLACVCKGVCEWRDRGGGTIVMFGFLGRRANNLIAGNARAQSLLHAPSGANGRAGPSDVQLGGQRAGLVKGRGVSCAQWRCGREG